MRAHVAEECKNDYAAQLQKYNKEKNQFYFSDMPLIFNVSELHTAKRSYYYHKCLFELLISGIAITAISVPKYC